MKKTCTFVIHHKKGRFKYLNKKYYSLHHSDFTGESLQSYESFKAWERHRACRTISRIWSKGPQGVWGDRGRYVIFLQLLWALWRQLPPTMKQSWYYDCVSWNVIEYEMQGHYTSFLCTQRIKRIQAAGNSLWLSLVILKQDEGAYDDEDDNP